MSVEVMQWLKGEIEKDTAEGKKLTLDFVSRLNEEVIRLEAWVHELKGGAAVEVKTVETVIKAPLDELGHAPQIIVEPTQLTGTITPEPLLDTGTVALTGTLSVGTLSTEGSVSSFGTFA